VGIILCYITLLTGNIWSAVIVHSLMALCNEWFSLRAHPEMKLIRDA
jgi:membrane protease YdiL (CAAX protease family)